MPMVKRHKLTLREQLKRAEQDIERLQIQLAGCDAAALGATQKPARQGDWGWSAAYQNVLELRRNYDRLVASIE